MQDLRLAIRALRATPVLTTVAVLSLALGIGANTAIFSLVSSLVLRSLPVADPDRLARITSATTGPRRQYSYAMLDQIRRHRELFDGSLAYTDCCGTAILNIGEENHPSDRQFVSGDFFTTLGVRAFRGRMLTPADDVPAAATGPVAVVSYRLWRGTLGGREDAVGGPLVINRTPVTARRRDAADILRGRGGTCPRRGDAVSARVAVHQHAIRRRHSMVEHHGPAEARPLRGDRGSGSPWHPTPESEPRHRQHNRQTVHFYRIR